MAQRLVKARFMADAWSPTPHIGVSRDPDLRGSLEYIKRFYNPLKPAVT